jgi:phosphatidylethanolamine/phosphatidyl-N-methylethanolamine N-methyltransferase
MVEGIEMLRSDALPFLRAWLSDPLRVGAVAPSGGALADLITGEISPETGPVLELGPGTGAFTQALLARGVAEHDLTLVELGPDFARMLELRFSKARILRMDASLLARVERIEGAPFGAAVSGLPLLTMPPRKVMAILGGAFRHLRGDGRFYQFTYGPKCPVPAGILNRLGLEAARIGWRLRNIPPAAVYRISRKIG